MIKLTAVIITYNEAKNIKRCLASVIGVVDEVIVVDSYSTDNTKAICQEFNVTFIEQNFLGYVEQKDFALKQASHNYIVSLDADEALSETLKKSILNLKKNWECDGYYCNRFNNFCGQWIKHSDWYPNKKLRVFDRTKAFWDGHLIHESIKFRNKLPKIGHLKGDILHYTYQSYSEFNLKTEHFSNLSAQSYFELGKKAPVWKIVVNPLWAFFKAYVLRLGFLDGFNGFVICVQTANITFLKYSKLKEMYKNNPT